MRPAAFLNEKIEIRPEWLERNILCWELLPCVVILIALWGLGLVRNVSMDGIIQLLRSVAIIVVVVGFITGRRVCSATADSDAAPPLKGTCMNAIKMAAIVLIVLGVLGLTYGGFTYTRETHHTKLGPLELTVKDQERVNIPLWAGVGAIIAGGVLLVMGGRKGR